MGKVTPYWTTEAETPAVYHNQSECKDGKQILDKNRESGTPPADRRLCEVCDGLA